jgi:hypothetical protein
VDTSTRRRIIPDRGEFVDALRRLQRGHVLVRAGDSAGGCVIDGAPVFHSFETMRSYGLIDRYDNPRGFAGVEYYRLSPRGRDFAERAWQGWRSRPLVERLLVRLTG